MELTRRDAVAALAALGAGGAAAGGYHLSQGDSEDDASDDEDVRATLVAAAEVVYPSEVDGIEPFVRRFLDGRLDDSEHAEGVRTAVTELDDHARSWYDDRFVSLSAETRDSLLREIGADTAEEVPDGTTAERVRYYVVNELLLALYSSPKGGKLVGIENPQGHPGGTDSYQRGPQR
ncbi:gluconate 2-dehydrogenase subunit 3 family protein [Natronomonas halophila]|uniref:gluconate 2-dehydrogenase subunit 3 family protein n=1 Tax=Natronomonas halophila TaxID=2747817 RepID=UPI0015B5FFF8|nr:gluconate 2-dehydrogenase subunit 3 family protein [Natronomonas halophila]QLD85106.1 gluconate 2-dehydrogenase subunit 3 family protein [Natronomonas halophila]